MASNVTVTITIRGHSSYVTDIDMENHLGSIARNISEYAENLKYEDSNRKIQVDYESQKDVDLEINVKSTGITT